MTSRTKKIIGVIVGVIILLILLLLLWPLRQQPIPTVVNNQPTQEGQTGNLNTSGGGAVKPPVIEATEPSVPEADTADPRSNLKSVAAAFAERYGSYSNQGNFENLEELRALMTDSLSAQTETFVEQARASSAAGAAYVGYTTRSIGTTVSGFSEIEGTATVVVNTQRQELTAQGTRVYYQELELKFVREGEIWKVDSAVWAEQSG
jgi:hypothetical protein